MTLILTELTRHGIAMAADSTLTAVHPGTGVPQAIPNAAQKLQQIPTLSAGISFWGLGQIDGQFTDQWIAHFINNTTATTIDEFASHLADRLNAVIGPNTNGCGRLGFHVAGFVDHHGQPTPTFFHVHDGPSDVLARRHISIDPTQFNANNDVPPDIARKHISAGGYITRNGDFQIYARMFHELENFFDSLQSQGVIVPNTNNLSDRAEYLVFQIRTVAEVYRLSNLVPGIGGAIQYLTITPTGIRDFGVRYY